MTMAQRVTKKDNGNKKDLRGKVTSLCNYWWLWRMIMTIIIIIIIIQYIQQYPGVPQTVCMWTSLSIIFDRPKSAEIINHTGFQHTAHQNIIRNLLLLPKLLYYILLYIDYL